MQKIVPHLWFDKEVREATKFYVEAFGGDSKILGSYVLHNTPSGDVDVVSFKLLGFEFLAINGGPFFKMNPAISFTVVCKDNAELDALWAKLSSGGKVLMELAEYPFSKYYGWVSDKWGVSWQLIVDDGHYAYKQKITPTLMYVGPVAGRAEEAMNYYTTLFPDSKMGGLARYPAGMEHDKEGTIMHGAVILAGQEFFAMDSAHPGHEFNFNEGVSLIIRCDTQEEIDYYWQLSAVPESEQCGWIKDKFGVSWQVTPIELDQMMESGDQAKIDRVTAAFMPMKKLDLAKLREAAEGK